MRIECCPRRSPAIASSRFAGGARKSFKSRAWCNISSLREATRPMPLNCRTNPPIQNVSVALSRNDLIIQGHATLRHVLRQAYNARRETWSPSPSAPSSASRNPNHPGSKASKQSFFEKKDQKTFINSAAKPPDKSFLLLFSKKEGLPSSTTPKKLA